MKTLTKVATILSVLLLPATLASQPSMAKEGAKNCHARPLPKSHAPRWKRTCREVVKRQVPVALAQTEVPTEDARRRTPTPKSWGR